MPKTNIIINQSSHFLWEYITKPENWEKWWGAPLKKVEPCWVTGAVLTWGNDQQSELTEVKEKENIQIFTAIMQTTFHFQAVDDDTTLLEYEFNPMGGAVFSDGGEAHISSINMRLTRLKEYIELPRCWYCRKNPQDEASNQQIKLHRKMGNVGSMTKIITIPRCKSCKRDEHRINVYSYSALPLVSFYVLSVI